MRHFVIFLPLPEEQMHLHERALATARAFFETTATAERLDIGTFGRSAKPNRPLEYLPLVIIRSPADKSREKDIARARALEAVLRATLGAAGVPSLDVRVFVSLDEGLDQTASTETPKVQT